MTDHDGRVKFSPLWKIMMTGNDGEVNFRSWWQIMMADHDGRRKFMSVQHIMMALSTLGHYDRTWWEIMMADDDVRIQVWVIMVYHNDGSCLQIMMAGSIWIFSRCRCTWVPKKISALVIPTCRLVNIATWSIEYWIYPIFHYIQYSLAFCHP